MWSAAWEFVGTIHNFSSPGCYALFAGDRLLYVGQTLGSISFRTGEYTRVADGGLSIPPETRPYTPSPQWKDRKLDSILTIPIPPDYSYLVLSLEVFLIAKLTPPFNTRRVDDNRLVERRE